MYEREKTTCYHIQSRKHILISTLIAAVVAAIILVTVVLPVEYGIDPTRIGNALGLTAISEANKRPQNTVVNKAPVTTESPVTVPMESGNDPLGVEWFKSRDPYGPAEINPGSKKFTGNFTSQFRSEIIEIPVQPDAELEYKFLMQAGQMLVYSWDSGDREMYFEFHAEPTEGEYPEGYYMSYQIGDGSTGEHGSLVAPFTGNHGWYFLNLTEHPAIIKLQVSGYYESHGRLHY